MGWRDAPVVDEAPAWQSAPEVGRGLIGPPVPEVTEKPSLGSRLYENIIGSGAVDTPGERLGEYIRGAGAAVARGIADVPALPVNIAQLGATGVEWATGMENPSMVSRGLDALPDTRDMLAAVPVIGPESQYTAPGKIGEYISTAGEFGGNVGLLAGPSAIMKYGVVPGITSEAAGQATEGTGWEPAARLAAGIATPSLTTFGLNALKRGITPNPATPLATQSAQVLDDAGVRLTAGQRTGSNPLKLNERMTVAGEGLTGQAADDFTAAAMRSINSPSPVASRAAIADAYDDIGGQFNALANRYNAVADQTLVDDALAAVSKYADDAAPAAGYPTKVINEIQDAFNSGVPLTGNQYQTISSRLGEYLGSGNPEKIRVARELRLALDNALERTITTSGGPGAPTALAQWQEARRLWTNLLVVSKAAGTATGRSEMITPAALGNAVKAVQGNRRLVTGSTELGPLADAGAVAFKAPYGTEAMYRNKDLRALLAPTTVGGGLGYATGAAVGGPVGGAVGASIGAGVGSLVPRGVNAAKMTGPGQRYLANQTWTSPAQSLMDQRLYGTIAAGIANGQGQ